MGDFKVVWWLVVLLFFYAVTSFGNANFFNPKLLSNGNGIGVSSGIISGIDDLKITDPKVSYITSKASDTTSAHIFKYHRRTIFDFSIGLGSGGNRGVSFASTIAILFPITKGSRHLVGYSMGIEDLKGRFNSISFPIGIRYQVYLNDNEFVKPFVYASAGWGFVRLQDDFVTFRDPSISGLRTEVGVGVSFINQRKDLAWYIRTAYLNQSLDYDFLNPGWGSSDYIVEKLRRIMFIAGFNF